MLTGVTVVAVAAALPRRRRTGPSQRPNRLASRGVQGLGCLIALAGPPTAFVWALIEPASGLFDQLKIIAAAIFLAVSLPGIGILVFVSARRLRPPSIDAVRASKPRPPVLFVRPLARNSRPSRRVTRLRNSSTVSRLRGSLFYEVENMLGPWVALGNPAVSCSIGRGPFGPLRCRVVAGVRARCLPGTGRPGAPRADGCGKPGSRRSRAGSCRRPRCCRSRSCACRRLWEPRRSRSENSEDRSRRWCRNRLRRLASVRSSSPRVEEVDSRCSRPPWTPEIAEDPVAPDGVPGLQNRPGRRRHGCSGDDVGFRRAPSPPTTTFVADPNVDSRAGRCREPGSRVGSVPTKLPWITVPSA